MTEKNFKEKQRKRQRQRRVEARRWRTVLTKDTSNLKALENLARLSCLLHLPRKALFYANAALAEYPFSTEALRWKGHAYLCMDQGKTAETVFKEAIAINPYDDNLYKSLSVTYGLIGETKKQIEVFKKATKILHNNPEFYSLIGDAITDAAVKDSDTLDEEMQARDKAANVTLPWYRKAILKDPTYSEGWCKYGYALNRCNRTKAAIKAFTTFVSLEPHNYNAWQWLGNVYRASGKYKQAEKLYKRAIQLEPRSSHSYFMLGYTYVEMGEKEKATAECEKLKKLDRAAAKCLWTCINM